MSALMLIKQAEIVNNNNGNGGISPLGATAIGVGGVGAGALGMRWHKNKQIGQLDSALTESNNQLNEFKKKAPFMKGNFTTTGQMPPAPMAPTNNAKALNLVEKPKLNGLWHNVTHIFK